MRECNETNTEVTFTFSDVRNKYGPALNESILDCTNLVEHLKQRQASDPELDYNTYLDEEGTLERVFFVLKVGKFLWNQLTSKVLLFDPKHSTNRYGLKLGCLVSIDPNGKTRVLAGSFIYHENEESFGWIFQKFLLYFGSIPMLIFTDSDNRMASALRACWPTSTHLLCTFHIWKNFWTHIHPLFNGDPSAWRIVASMFWQLCKNSDEKEAIVFDAKFNDLVTYVKMNATAKKEKVETQVEWLSSLLGRKEQWAACFTWKERTYGIHSTQRAEAIHSGINVFCSKTSTILDMVKDLERMSEEHHTASAMTTIDAMLGVTIGRKPILLPVCEVLQGMLRSFPRMLVNAQAAQIVRYNCCALNDDISQVNDLMSLLVSPALRQFRVFVHRASVDNNTVTVNVDHEVLHGNYVPESMADVSKSSPCDHGIDEIVDINGTPRSSLMSNSHVASLLGCTCQFPKCWGLPCRHMLRVMFHLGIDLWEQANMVS